MNVRSFKERVELRIARCRPVSTGGADLLRLYVASLDLGRTNRVDGEMVILAELCRLVEEVEFDTWSAEHLRALGRRSAPSRTAAERRRQLASRLIRLLQAAGPLPSSAELRANRQIHEIVTTLPPVASDRLAGWIENLSRRTPPVGWHQLLLHARVLAQLELLLDELQLTGAGAGDAVELWLGRVTREIVDCGCPPVTRARTPDSCTMCGATAASHGTRRSPGARKQRELEALARRYLDWAFPDDDIEAAA